MFVAGVLPTYGGPAVVLRDKTEKTLLPIWIGTSEAHSIQLRIERRRFPRPLTHDLLDAIVHDLGGEILKIHVDDLKGDTFVGTVFVRKGERIAHFDARPSDSIALAVGNSAPIFVSKAVIDRIGAQRKTEKEPAAKSKDPDAAESPKEALPKGVHTL
jgi:bifunctional DNase/RNase